MQYILLVIGILILVAGKVKVTKGIVIAGKAAYFLAISYISYFVLTFLLSFVGDGVAGDICCVILATAFYIIIIITILVIILFRSKVVRDTKAETGSEESSLHVASIPGIPPPPLPTLLKPESKSPARKPN